MAKVSNVLTYARVIARTDSNGISDANGILFASDAQKDLLLQMIERKQDIVPVQESKRSITSSQIVGGSQPGKFLFPADMWLLKLIQVNLFDPANLDLFKEAGQYDVSNLPPGSSWEQIKRNQAKDAPMVDLRGDWFEVAPTPTQILTDAIRIFYYLAPTDYTLITDDILYPFSLYPEALAYKVASLYFLSLPNPDKTNAQLNDAKATNLIEKIIKMIGAGTAQQTKTRGLGLTGWEF